MKMTAKDRVCTIYMTAEQMVESLRLPEEMQKQRQRFFDKMHQKYDAICIETVTDEKAIPNR